MTKIAVRISEFQPVTEKLELYDEAGNLIEGSDEVWVKLNPPTFREDKIRGDMLKTSFNTSGAMSLTNPRLLQAEEIWLTFGGTNLEVELPKLDSNGKLTYTEGEDGEMVLEMETISFPDDPSKISRQEFLMLLERLPEWIVHSWHSLVIRTVAKGWAFPF